MKKIMGVIASQVCRELGICAKTLQNYEERGLIASVRTAGNWRLYNPEDVARLKKEMATRAADRQKKYAVPVRHKNFDAEARR